MLEDCTMEKKPTGRSVQAPGKISGTDSKKLQDGSNSKPFPRSWRREPNACSSAKNDPNKKPIPQKNKCFDKRLQPRGQYNNSGKENTKVADSDIEYGSVFVPGSKKHNLNHLLNFHYPPRESGILRTTRQNPARWLSSTHKHKYNKEQFLQATCQFIVKSDGDYSAHASSPDILVNWDLVEQIRLQSSEVLSCPICLYPPVAAKITRCGHVFCWSCILHYLALSDKTWRKCPICYDAVHRHDLKSVIAVPQTQFAVGTEIKMRLMKRERGSMIALPVNQSSVRPNDQPFSVSETSVDTVYSKLLLATPLEVMGILEKERCELKQQMQENEGCPEMCFIEEALKLLDDRQSGLSGKVPEEDDLTSQGACAITDSAASEDTKALVYESAFDNEMSNVYYAAKLEEESRRSRYESMSSDDGNMAALTEDFTQACQIQTSPTKHFYFYQAADGQHIYLHALNVRMLEHQFGSLENSPTVLTGRIIEKESGSMTEELRKRLRYLQHLPVTCQFEVAEIQLRSPPLNQETLAHFQEQLEARRRRRHRRARDERRREKLINEEENRRWGRYPTPHIRIESHQHFPQCGTEPNSIVGAVSTSPTLSSVASSRTQSNDSLLSASITQPESPVASSESAGMSFAQMLREGKSRVSGECISVNRSLGNVANECDSEAEVEGYVPAPTFSQSFSDAIDVALQKVVHAKEEYQDEATKSGKKKKKQKQKVLFATSMACSSK